jgi:hypothetical protein
MCALEHLGNHRPHIQFTIETNMSYCEHRNFFALFINKMYSISPSYIYFPCILEALQQQIQDNSGQHLPGTCGYIDVVHVKWSRCPAGDYKSDGLWLEGPETMNERFMGEMCIDRIKAADKREAI